jgi:hypothetical protein
MARYLLLSFNDNEEAEAIAKLLVNDRTAVINEGSIECEVVGLFAKPTQFCVNTQSGGCTQGKRYRSFVRGTKYGWWVCAVCKKPAGLPHGKEPRHVVGQGTNLLPTLLTDNEIDIPESVSQGIASVFDRGWGQLNREYKL